MTDRCELCDRVVGDGVGQCRTREAVRAEIVRRDLRGADAIRFDIEVRNECFRNRVNWRVRALSAEVLLPDKDECEALAGLLNWISAAEDDAKACEYIKRLWIGMRGRK